MKSFDLLALGFEDCNCSVFTITLPDICHPMLRVWNVWNELTKPLVAAAALLYGPHTVNLPTQLFRNEIHENMLALKKLAGEGQTSEWKGSDTFDYMSLCDVISSKGLKYAISIWNLLFEILLMQCIFVDSIMSTS